MKKEPKDLLDLAKGTHLSQQACTI